MCSCSEPLLSQERVTACPQVTAQMDVPCFPHLEQRLRDMRSGEGGHGPLGKGKRKGHREHGFCAGNCRCEFLWEVRMGAREGRGTQVSQTIPHCGHLSWGQSTQQNGFLFGLHMAPGCWGGGEVANV